MSEQNKPAVVATMEQFSFFNPEHLATMQRVGKMFANSELVPEMYKSSDNNPPEKAIANCVVAIEIATRIGASPLMVMQNMVPIYGKPSWSSKFLISTVNTCGRFKPLRFKFENLGVLKDYRYKEYVSEWVTGNNGKKYKKTVLVDKVFAGPVDNIQCIAYTTAKNSDEELESSPVSVKMAIDEGWYTKKGSKWQTMTKQMLMYRSASFWTSSYAPELSMGMKTEDEMRDIEDVSFVDVTDHTPERSKDEKSNSKEISMDDEPKENKHAKETPKTSSTQKMTFASMDEAKKFLIDDCGAAEEFLTDDAAINTVAAENGIRIEIKSRSKAPF